MATRKRSSAEQQRHNRWANLQWFVLTVLLLIATIAAFVLFDGGATGGHLN